jgi:oligopeptide transport system substrate-binding protein
MSTRRFALVVLAVLAVVALLVGCGGTTTTTGSATSTTQQGASTTQAPTSTTSGAKAAVFNYGVPNGPTSLDPHKLYGNASIELAQNLFDGLTQIDANMQVQPAIATSWDISADGLTYTFHLRKDVKFSNGDPVTAEDFKWSFARGLDPKIGNPQNFMMELMKGSKAIEDGLTTDLSGVQVLDPYTLQVTLMYPAGYFLDLTTRWPYWVLDKKVIDKYGDAWTQPGNLVGTGAYTLAAAVEDSSYTFAANPTYFQGEPTIKKATAYILPDASTRLMQYQAGQLDAITTLSPAELQITQADSTLSQQFKQIPQLRTSWLEVRLSKPPFKDNLALRQALAYAIDRDQLVKVALGGVGAPAQTFLPPGMPAYNADLKLFPFDPALAKQKLAEAGYPEGKGFPKLDILIPADTENQKVYEFVQAQFKTNLGIDIGITQAPNKSFAAITSDPNQRPALFQDSMGADYPDPQEFLEYFGVSTSFHDWNDFKDAQYEQLVLDANKSSDQAERVKLYQQAEPIYLNAVGIIPLYYATANYLLNNKFTGFGFSPLYLTPLADVKPAA